jgi:hypothetical protein
VGSSKQVEGVSVPFSDKLLPVSKGFAARQSIEKPLSDGAHVFAIRAGIDVRFLADPLFLVALASLLKLKTGLPESAVPELIVQGGVLGLQGALATSVPSSINLAPAWRCLVRVQELLFPKDVAARPGHTTVSQAVLDIIALRPPADVVAAVQTMCTKWWESAQRRYHVMSGDGDAAQALELPALDAYVKRIHDLLFEEGSKGPGKAASKTVGAPTGSSGAPARNRRLRSSWVDPCPADLAVRGSCGTAGCPLYHSRQRPGTKAPLTPAAK